MFMYAQDETRQEKFFKLQKSTATIMIIIIIKRESKMRKCMQSKLNHEIFFIFVHFISATKKPLGMCYSKRIKKGERKKITCNEPIK